MRAEHKISERGQPSSARDAAQKSGHGKVQDSTKNHFPTLMPEHLMASGNTFLVIFQHQDCCLEILTDGFVQL